MHHKDCILYWIGKVVPMLDHPVTIKVSQISCCPMHVAEVNEQNKLRLRNIRSLISLDWSTLGVLLCLDFSLKSYKGPLYMVLRLQTIIFFSCNLGRPFFSNGYNLVILKLNYEGEISKWRGRSCKFKNAKKCFKKDFF